MTKIIAGFRRFSNSPIKDIGSPNYPLINHAYGSFLFVYCSYVTTRSLKRNSTREFVNFASSSS
jgi:hypothetical protein